ncbi:MAG: carboxypeptidase regulatory-like domain-containing protein [Kofleriaceae bacterium]|nr:carboxypeptidase regulatory-like domain-containing protein [Kofleriaceae bacterium]
MIKLREGSHLVVTVVDSARAPLAKAEIRIDDDEAAVFTDTNGEARLTAFGGWVTVEARAAGYAPRRTRLPIGPAGTTSRLTIVMHAGFAVSGRVIDEQAKPIANARIYALQSSAMLRWEDLDQEDDITDQNGRFTISEAVGMHAIAAIDDEHAPAMTPSFDVDGPVGGIEIVMKRGAVYAGAVFDPSGKPVADARVHCDTTGPLGERRVSATTASNGEFEVRGLARTMLIAHARLENAASNETKIDLTQQPELRGQRLVLHPGETANGVIAGIVVDDAGAPVADVTVNAVLRDRSPAELVKRDGVASLVATSATTDPRGQFSITDLPPGDYGLWAGAFDRPLMPVEAATFLPGLDPSRIMTSAKTGDKNVRLVLKRSGGVRGKVAFADTGEPVPSFTVDREPAFENELGVPARDGRFELTALPPGTFSLRIHGAGFLHTQQTDVHIEPGTISDLGIITVQRGRTLRGKVVDPAGRPVAGANVMLGHTGVYGGIGRFDQPDVGLGAAVTDASGAFSFAGVPIKPPGPGMIVGADHPSFGRALPVQIPAGTSDPAPITLELRECGSIAGTVVQNGKRISALIGAGWPELGMADTDEDGAFVISRLPAGPVPLRISPSTAMRMQNHQLTVQVEPNKQTEVTIDIPIGTIRLSVVVRPKPGHEVASASLFLFVGTVSFDNYAEVTARMMADSQGLARWNGDATGPASFDRVVPGEYTVCTLPLAWSHDDRRMERVYRGDREALRVYCTPVRVLAAPSEQSMTVEIQGMSPLP